MTAFDGVVWGLDIASTTGMCCGRPGEAPYFETMKFSTKDGEMEDTWARAFMWVLDRTKIEKPDRAYLEAPLETFNETNPRTVHVLIGLYAIISSVLRKRGVIVRRSKVQTVRSFFIGHGNLKGEVAKPLVREQCRELGWRPPTLDCSDAAAVWAWGCHQVAPVRMPKPPAIHNRAKWVVQ